MRNKIIFLILVISFSSQAFAWEKTYTFWFKGAINSISLSYDTQSLEDCNRSVYQWQKAHGTLSGEKDVNYKRYIAEAPCNNMVEGFVTRLNDLALHDMVTIENRKDYAELFLAFVNGIPYAKDIEAWHKDDFIQTPFQTLYFNQGDCEDHAILLASMYKLLCYDTVFLSFPTHLAVGLSEDALEDVETDEMTYYPNNGKRYYYCEATRGEFCPTCENFEIGKVPESKKGKSADVESFNCGCN